MIFVNYPGHFVAAVVFLIVAVVMFFAFKSRELGGRGLWRWLVGLLQYGSIIVLLLILWDPSRPEMGETTSKNSVLVLFDTSRSMSVADEGERTRLDEALKIFADKFDPANPDGPDYKVYGFDSQCYWVPSLKALSGKKAGEEKSDSSGQDEWGWRTNMHGAFELLSRYAPVGGPLEEMGGTSGVFVGAVVFTDGQADDKNVEAYLPFREKNFKTVFLGMGSRDPKCDVWVKSVKAPSRVAIDTAYSVRVEVSGRNLGGKGVTVDLLKDDYVIASKQLASEAVGGGVTTEFLVGADGLGRHSLLARARSGEREVNAANNARSTMVEVVENAKLKVLLYSQVANFDVGKIRQALIRDKKIQLDLGLDAIVRPSLSSKAQTMCGHVKLPAERSGFYGYDVIILGPCAIDNLSEAQIDGLYSYVVDRGGGLILLPGRADYGPAGWSNEKIRSLVPVFFEAGPQMTGPSVAGKMQLSLEGIASKAISKVDFSDQEMMVRPYYKTLEKKPAATTLASVRGKPVIAVHRVGRGRVCLLNVSKLFRWYREDTGGGVLQKFITGLTGYVGRVTNLEATVELFAERVDGQGGMMKFDAYVRDNRFAPVESATVLLNVDEQVLRMDQVGEGRYAAQAGGIDAEAVVATAQAELDGVFLGEKTIAVNLPQVRSEMDNVELDSKFLKALASRTGGKYYDADKAGKDLVRMFEAKKRVSSFARMESVWPRWSLLLGLCLLLSLTWFVRRSIGLV